ASGRLGAATRYNTYRLTWSDAEGNKQEREIYAPGKAPLLAGQLGRRVRLIGKAVETKADGKTYQEIWPARLEAPEKVAPELANGIHARCDWPPAALQRAGAHYLVINNGADLAKLMRQYGKTVDETATAQLAKTLGVPAIDWQKQMLVCVCAGLHANSERLTI